MFSKFSMLVLIPSLVCSSTAYSASFIAPSDKGDFQYSSPSPYPDISLDLAPIERQVATAAATRCGTPLAAAPLDLGDAQGFMSKMVGAAANAAIGKLVGGLLGGGGGGSNKKPQMAKDPVKNKFKQKIEHPGGDARIRVGGQAYSNGLLISAKVDKAAGKGTFHTMFLEQPDCTRIWPEAYAQYGLWGSWSLSVSVTKTSSTYRDGKLVDRSSLAADSSSDCMRCCSTRSLSLPGIGASFAMACIWPPDSRRDRVRSST